MILKIVLWACLCSYSHGIIHTQTIPSAVVTALEQADAEGLLPYLSAEVSFKVADKHIRASKEQVVKELTQFMTDPTYSFKMKHTSDRAHSGFFIGSLQVGKAKYRINCFFKRINNHLYIHQIRIDNAKD